MRIAFYAPLKGPDHPVPSGDRQMARLLIKALRAAGHRVEMASTLRSFLAAPDHARQAEIEAEAEVEAAAIENAWRGAGAAPDLWFTYHPFYKAPDFLGARLAGRFAIPYVTAEASNAPKRAIGPWARWHAATEAALQAGAVHFCFTGEDREGLEPLLGPGSRVVDLPPFIDAPTVWGELPRPTAGDTVQLVAVAMMRPGDKMRSFAFLADALRRLPGRPPWHLSVVGDGPARQAVEACFASVEGRHVSFLGEVAAEAVGRVLAGADLYVWPGFNEAYGLSYLEAGAAGLPVVAMRCRGVPCVVLDGRTGVLVPEGDVDAYASAVIGLMADEVTRRRLGRAAKSFVVEERSLSRAAAILDAGVLEARATP